jgi:hypothetical protein
VSLAPHPLPLPVPLCVCTCVAWAAVGLGVLAGVDSAGSAAGGLSSGDGCQRHDDCRLSSTEEVLGAVFAAVVYCAISSCLGVYAWLIWRQAEDSRANKVSFRTGFVKKDQKASGIVPVLGVAALIFGGRTIYVTLLAAGVASPCATPPQ